MPTDSDFTRIPGWPGNRVCRHEINETAYAEISLSDRGIKIFVQGKLPGGGFAFALGDGRVEVYDRARYFAVTGNHWAGQVLDIEEHQADPSTSPASAATSAAGGLSAGIAPPEGGSPSIFGTSSSSRRYDLTLSPTARNLLNHLNPGPITGNITSPLFGLSRSSQVAEIRFR